jgi:hypothetical protein
MDKYIKIRSNNKLAVDKILVGVPATQAIRETGHTPHRRQIVRHNAIKRVMESKGVQFYLKRINEALEVENAKFLKSKEGKSKAIEMRVGERILPRLVIKTYVEGLNATKLYGKDAIEHPDTKVRILAADRLSEFFKWRRQEGTPSSPTGTNYSQFNFFSVPEDKRGKFDQDFKVFLKHFYNKNKDQDS